MGGALADENPPDRCSAPRTGFPRLAVGAELLPVPAAFAARQDEMGFAAAERGAQVPDPLAQDGADRVEQFRRLRGVEASGILREDAPGIYKLSLRSTGTTDVRPVAVQFGGGGHTRAAGCTLLMSFEEAKRTICEAISQAIRAYHCQGAK